MIYKHKTDLMREIIRLVSHGYHHWISGSVDPKKTKALVWKFEDRYSVNSTSQQRYRRKAKGLANVRLLMWPNDDSGKVDWWLFATDGESEIFQMEQMTDIRAKSGRIRITITGYELVKTPRSGRSAQWSWRMTKLAYDQWRDRIKTAVRKQTPDDSLIRQALFSLRRVPGFAESRRQAFSLERYAIDEWRRVRRGDWPYERIFVGWVGRFVEATKIDSI